MGLGLMIVIIRFTFSPFWVVIDNVTDFLFHFFAALTMFLSSAVVVSLPDLFDIWLLVHRWFPSFSAHFKLLR